MRIKKPFKFYRFGIIMQTFGMHRWVEKVQYSALHPLLGVVSRLRR